jgi:hypothetical protein
VGRVLGLLFAAGFALGAAALVAPPSEAGLAGIYGDDGTSPVDELAGGLDDPLDGEPVTPPNWECVYDRPDGAWGDCYPVDLAITFHFEIPAGVQYEYRVTPLPSSNCALNERGSPVFGITRNPTIVTDAAGFWARSDGGCYFERSNQWFSVEIARCETVCKWLGDPWIRHINVAEDRLGPHAPYGVQCGPGGLPCLSTEGSETETGRRTARVEFFQPSGSDLTYPVPAG